MERMKLERKNKNLKENLDIERRGHLQLARRVKQLEEENKKLNIKVASLEGEIKGLNYTIDKLKEENQTLELWLDNKEKVNKSLREELSAYDREYFDEDKKAKNIFKEDDTYVYDAKQVRDIC